MSYTRKQVEFEYTVEYIQQSYSSSMQFLRDVKERIGYIWSVNPY